MKRSDIGVLPEYFDRYILLVDDVELDQAFDLSVKEIDDLDVALLERVGNRTYAPGKWTVPQTIQHLVDVERILTYRTLLIARGDLTEAASFDQDLLAAESLAIKRELSDIAQELRAVRASTRHMFHSFDTETLKRKGRNWKYEVTVLTMAYIILGHQRWHFNILREKYPGLS
jgi:hypothetical protein